MDPSTIAEEPRARGIYLHVPFCARKCAYCDFYSVPAGAEAARGFRDLVVREIDLFREALPAEAAVPADTVYFGGGTPTILGADALCALLAAIRERFTVTDGAEITAEANPGTASAAGLAALRRGGFNRLSIGIQSFDSRTLAVLGRIHGEEEARATWRAARAAGFDALGLDLIFGIPGQDLGSWSADLERAATFRPAHVSAYALAPEPGTPLHRAVSRGELSMPPDDEVAAMYEETRRILSGSGFRQYEISNFAQPGAACRHNLKYWRREGYVGLGPAAHGLLFPREKAPYGLRTANPPSLADYGRRIGDGELPWGTVTACTREDAWKEALIFGLRETAGVDLAATEKKWGVPPLPVRDALESLTVSGKLLSDGARLRLPDDLLFVSNEVLSALA